MKSSEYGKEIIRFGHWIVTSEGIVYEKRKPPYFIAKNRLWETRPDGKDDKWDWLIHLTEKTWLGEKALYELNTAFFFAQDYFKDLKPSGCEDISTWKTIKVQMKEFSKFDRK